jgi:hypothetical protein
VDVGKNLSESAHLSRGSICYVGGMRSLLLLVLVGSLVACEPGDVVDVDINPSQGVENAVDRVQQGVDGLNDAVQNFGEGAEGGEENQGEGEGEEN